MINTDDTRPKTGYTYAESLIYNSRATPNRKVPSPNMSRPSTHSSDSDRSSYSLEKWKSSRQTHVTELSAAKATDVGASPLLRVPENYPYAHGYGYTNSSAVTQAADSYTDVHRLSFGLDHHSDSESELEESVDHRGHNTHTYTAISQRVSFFSKFMRTIIYAPIAWCLWFESWLLSRSLYKSQNKERTKFPKMVIFLILLPLLLYWLWGLLPGSLPSSVSGTTLASYIISPLLAFWNNTHSQVSQQSTVVTPTVDFSGFQTQLDSLHQQIQMLSLQIQKEKQDLKKEQTEARIKNLQDQLDQLESAHLELKEDHLALLVASRNCCRNASYYQGLIEDHINNMFLATSGSAPYSASSGSLTNYIHDIIHALHGESQEKVDDRIKQITDNLTARVYKDIRNMVNVQAQTIVAAAISEYSAEHAAVSENSAPPSPSITAGVFTGLFGSQVNESLNRDVESLVKRLVRDAIVTYDADKTGMADYALESQGGSVVSTRCTETFQKDTAQLSLFGIPLWYKNNSPRVVLQPGVHPGECWAFKGSEGYLVIKLSGRVRPTYFSLDHIPKRLAPNGTIDAAPKEFSVWGLRTEGDVIGLQLGRYVYDADGESLQTFPVQENGEDAYELMELRIHSNYGNVQYTCLYRFRVHGTLLR